METFARQDKADSLLVNHLPEVARRATRIRTVKQKKSGLAGALGGKETVQVLPSAKELHQFSDSLHAGRADGRDPVARRTIPLADSRCHPQRGGRRSAAVGRTADPCQRERGRHGWQYVPGSGNEPMEGAFANVQTCGNGRKLRDTHTGFGQIL